ncbi:DsbA family protein [Natronobiforma cellulositropha]
MLALGGVSTIAVAGCLGNGGGEADGDEDAGSEGGNEDGGGEGADGETLESHPVGVDLAEKPRLGPDPFDAPATLVVLDDPSCPRCAAYHQGTVAELRESHVAAGELSIVYRPYPVVYDWGERAAHALEATVERDPEAFWPLLGYYFDEQSSFTSDTVLERTASWLTAETDLDAAGIVADAREETFADRIETTLEAGSAAGAGGVTPVSYTFVDGVFQSPINGSASTTAIETALQL